MPGRFGVSCGYVSSGFGIAFYDYVVRICFRYGGLVAGLASWFVVVVCGWLRLSCLSGVWFCLSGWFRGVLVAGLGAWCLCIGFGGLLVRFVLWTLMILGGFACGCGFLACIAVGGWFCCLICGGPAVLFC